jgi:hypothetical protein
MTHTAACDPDERLASLERRETELAELELPGSGKKQTVWSGAHGAFSLVSAIRYGAGAARAVLR